MSSELPHDAAIVVGRQDLGEADRILRLLTETYGRVDVLARGARASRRRSAASLDVGTQFAARWQRGRGALPLLADPDDVHTPIRARGSWARLTFLAYGCEVVARLAEAAPDARQHRLLRVFIDVLDGRNHDPTHALRVALEAKALTFAGLTPRLTTCARCGAPLDGVARFDHDAGGAVHRDCGAGPLVASESLVLIEQLRRTPLAETGDCDVPNDALWLLSDFVVYQTAAPLRARAAFEPLELP